MKTKFFKVLAVIFAATFALLSLGGCGSTDGSNDTTAAVSTEAVSTEAQTTEATSEPPTTLTMYIQERWPGVGYDNYVNNYIQQQTNTKWDLTVVGAADLETKLNVVLASGKKFDVMQYGSNNMEMKLVEGGILYPLNQGFDKYQNLGKYGAADGMWNAMTYPDGNIYSVPVKGLPQAQFIPIYRQDWLDKLGLKVPTTLDEYYKVAVAVSQNDPDGNSKKDTYAFGSYGVSDLRCMDFIFGAYGGHPAQWMDVNGHIENSAIQPGAKEALIYLNKLYKAGTIDPEFVTDNEARYKTKYLSGIYGAAAYKIQLFDTNNLNNYHNPFYSNNPNAKLVVGPALAGGSDNPSVQRMLSQRGWLKTGISKDSKYVDAALKVLDWITSDTGEMLCNYGEEGVDHTLDSNGVVTMLGDEAAQQQRGVNQCDLAITLLIKQTSLPFQQLVAQTDPAAKKDPTDGIMVEQVKYWGDLEGLRTSEYAKMIVGEEPIDSGFDKFVNEWNKRGGAELTKAMDEQYQKKKGN